MKKTITHRGKTYSFIVGKIGNFTSFSIETLEGNQVAYRWTDGLSFHKVRPEGSVVMASFTNDPYKNQGFGSLLLKETIKYLKKEKKFSNLLVSVRKENLPCLKMIEKSGTAFEVASSRSDVKCFIYSL